MAYQEKQLQEISKQFQIYGEILHAETFKIGHINETYSATYDQGGMRVRYIHQKINKGVFKNPPAVMKNVMRVTTHIRRKLESRNARDITRRSLIVIPTRAGQSFYRSSEGEYWRTFVFIEGVETFEAVQTPDQAFEAGRAFGEFQSLLVDLPGERLHETIPNFHNTRKRFTVLHQAIEKDHLNRAKEAYSEIKFALAHEEIVDVILNAMARRKIPERITHNDTKFNNVMLDTLTGEARCVVDLDTVMPGCALYDFGDMVRTTTSPTLEDERDLSKVKMHMPTFKRLAQGYLSTAGTFLTRAEKSHLAFAGKLITFEIGIRFLTDFLSGDTYFRIHRPGHNLDRSRTQFKLVESIERQEAAMQKFVDRL
ncbi:MAG: aminoglycoside phosphotransferase family protein [Verrucomicrobia bacterium]|nr:aminoglycoside phosphotransferase family protein [Verrucomicrobiota bacterium]